MKRKICLIIIAFVAAFTLHAEKSYDITEIYSVIEAENGTKAIGKYDKVIDVKQILVPTRMDKGKYIVEVKKIGDNLYQIKNSDICIETRYCHEWASFAEEVVLIIDSYYGYTKGKIIFD